MSLTRAGWIPQDDIDLPAWVALGKRFGQMCRGVQWWIGDWLRYGTSRWGEKYTDAAKITGYDPGSLRNMSYLATEFDLSRRRDKLTWSHHAAVAGLAPAEQERWLDRAELVNLSVADLRLELRAPHRSRTLSGDDEPSSDKPAIGSNDRGVDEVICPVCGNVLPLGVPRG